MNYILLTIYNRGTIEKPIWEVYGWKDYLTNSCLDSFKTRLQAIEYAHTFFDVPVLLTSKGEKIAKKLQKIRK